MKKEEMKDNSFGVAGVILGILSVVFSNIPGLILGVIGLIFGRQQKKIMKNKWSRWGILLNIIGIILSLVTLAVALYVTMRTGLVPQI